MKRTLWTGGLSALFATTLLAADSTWISTSDTTWATAGNWSAGVPGAGLGAIFADGESVVHSIDLGLSQRSAAGITFNLFAGGSGFTFGSAVNPTPGITLRGGGTFAGILNNDDGNQTFNNPFIFQSVSGFGGAAASQTFNAAAGDLIISGAYNGSTATIANNGGRLTVDGAFDTTIGSSGRGDITGTGGLTKNGAGTLILGGTANNTYSGGTILNAGTLLAAKSGAFGNGGTMVLNGGTLQTGGFAESIASALSLQGNATLDLGPASGSPSITTVTFLDSHATSWASGALLTIKDWVPGDVIRFGSSGTGLTSTQLGQIIWADPDILGATTGIDPATGNIFPVPEPATGVLALLGGAVLAAGLIYRRR